MLPSLQGKCALITGSVQGLGLAAAECFADAGCHIVLNGFAPSGAVDAIRARVEDRCNVRTLYCGADLRHVSEIEHMVSAAIDAFGAVDIVVNNAVVRHAAPVEAFPVAHWDDGLAVNLSAAFHTIRLTLPGMKQKQWGRIINVSSILGLRAAPNPKPRSSA
jgi:3-hydroxybutyrate dehydrogenase